MKKAYEYIYYKIYKIARITEKSWGKEMAMPHWLALFIISIFLMLNSVLGLITYILLTHKVPEFDKIYIIVVMCGFFIGNYLLFIREDRYKKIIKKFDNESPKQKTIKTIFFWLYIVLSIGLLVVTFSM
ncbi:MAG TPA: hypothetical protein VF677_12515 [Flavobacterium sp.]|jgi:hypothetical protein